MAYCSGLTAGIIPALAGNTYLFSPTGRTPWDHPRACGEHFQARALQLAAPGSSPRLRGTQNNGRDSGAGPGIIPALAGNTRSGRNPSSSPRDHPRACGEHVHAGSVCATPLGSSPRLRGTPFGEAGHDQFAGIIPALAGNTRQKPPRLLLARDHPRACGEHQIITPVVIHLVGSSPRLRGTPSHERHFARHAGIIPALAGNTHRRWGYGETQRDHPRACGEHGKMASIQQGSSGSSPRLRGTPSDLFMSASLIGIIPALAGNTIACLSVIARRRDHPRACGEHLSDFPLLSLVLGSSPRLRGTLSPTTRISNVARDHPRACGEHAFLRRLTRSCPGSSPRLRGTPSTCLSTWWTPGIIPALAGNT